MGLKFRQLKKLWLFYLFLLFFAFFMFALSINLYIGSLSMQMREKFHPRQTRKHHFQPLKDVVAHYIGKADIFGNITAEEYDINDFHPIAEEGAEGRPVIVPARDSIRMQRFFKLNSFNIVASDRIPLNRTLKDYRIPECQKKDYSNQLPTTSVIIVFHNEAWSVLLRTITSVISRSPRHLLKEIILIDDASDRSYLKKPLENYVKALSVPTHLLRLQVRGGLVRARLLGAEHAKGQVLTFLDAHCECSYGWLEPLLARIQESRTTVICPVIDNISDDNFSYTKTFENFWGGFNWQLSFRWFSSDRLSMPRGNDSTKPIRTPGMAGGLFSIDRQYFYEIGSYDKEMKIWGGENVEMSFRIWQCGGSIEISPCSHVGHVFRSSTPYTFPGGMNEVLTMNLARAAFVWMDDWQYFILLYTAGLTLDMRDDVDVTERLALREKLQCKSFSWYLENIWPEHFFPAHDRFFGKIIWLDGETECAQTYSAHMKALPGRQLSREWPAIISEIEENAEKFVTHLDLDRDKCVRPVISKVPRTSLQPVTVGDCNVHPQSRDMFVITPHGQIMTNDNVCLTYNDHNKKGLVKLLKNRNMNVSNVQITQCFNDTRQFWNYDMATQQISHRGTGLCLTIKSSTVVHSDKSGTIVILTKCDFSDITQKWGLIPLPWTVY